MIVSTLCLVTTLLQGSVTFLGTYPTAYNDFVRSVTVLPENNYLMFGSTDSPFTEGARLIWTDMFGSCVLDSTPACADICGCLSLDSCIVAVSIQQNVLFLQKTTLSGTHCWTVTYPEYSDYSPRKIISSCDGGYVILSQVEDRGTTSSRILKTDTSGEFQWLTILEGSPTGISQNQYGSLVASVLHGTGGRIIVLNNTGQIQDQFDFPDKILRDVIFWNGVIAAAAVQDGILCIDNSGAVLWSYTPVNPAEIFSLTETADNDLAGTGSIMEGSQRRAFLVKVDINGSLIWDNAFGFGESFRSIFITLCPDGGFCSAGGYVNEGTLNSYLIKTDSMGVIEQQGFEAGFITPERQRIIHAPNPSNGALVTLSVQQTAGVDITLVVSDLQGRIVEEIGITPESSCEILIELKELETGLYFVNASTSSLSETLILTVLN